MRKNHLILIVALISFLLVKTSYARTSTLPSLKGVFPYPGWDDCITGLENIYPKSGAVIYGKIESFLKDDHTLLVVPIAILIETGEPGKWYDAGGSNCSVQIPVGDSVRSTLNTLGKVSLAKDSIACGSEIDFMDKSVIESIPIENTNLYLSYSSYFNPTSLKNASLNADYHLPTIVGIYNTVVTDSGGNEIPVISNISNGLINVSFKGTRGLGLTYSDSFKDIYDFQIRIQKLLAETGVAHCVIDRNRIATCSSTLPSYAEILSDKRTSINYKPQVFGLKGWTLSNHHFFDSASKTLFLGTGHKRSVKVYKTIQLAPYGDVHLVINPYNSQEIFVFNLEGKHLETRHAMFNFALYRFNYLADHRLDFIENEYGQRIKVFYDNLSNVTKIASYYGVETKFESLGDQLSKVTDSMGNAYGMTYDERNQLVTFKDINDVLTTFSYLDDGSLWKEEKNTGLNQYFSDFVSSRVRSFVRKLNFGSLEEVKSEAEIDRQVVKKYNDRNELLYTKTSYIHPVEETVALEKRTNTVYQNDSVWEYDLSDNYLMQVSLRQGGKTIQSQFDIRTFRSYADQNNPLSLTEINESFAETNVFKQTRLNLTLGSSPQSEYFDELGRRTVVDYDLFAKPIKSTPAGQFPTFFEYDAFGRLTTIKKANQRQKFEYDSYGYLASITDYKNQKTQVVRNIKGQVLKKILPNLDEINYEYTAAGEIKKIVTPSGQVHQFTMGLGDYVEAMLTPSNKQSKISYDSDKRVNRVIKPSGKVLDYVYQGKNLAKVTMPEGELKFLNYDSQDRVLSAQSADNIKLNMNWLAGTVSSQEWLDSDGSSIGSISFNYKDNQFRIEDIVVNGKIVASYSYEGWRLKSQQTDVTSRFYFNYNEDAHEIEFESETADFFLKQKTTDINEGLNQNSEISGTVTEDSQEYLAVNLKRIYNSLGQASEFTSSVYSINNNVFKNYFSLMPEYDVNGRLIQISKNRKSYKDGNEIASTDFYNQYSYPARSNNNMKEFVQRQDLAQDAIKRTIASHNNEDQLLELKGSINRKYSYSDDGETISMTNCYGTIHYEYDSFGTLKKVILADGKVIEYKTDAFNRRIKKLVDGQITEYYLWYDNQKLAAILDQNKNVKLIYLYGPESAHSPSYVIKENKTYKIVHDPGTGSVRYVIDPVNTYIVQELEYDEYGNMMRNSNPGWQPILYAGGLYDSDIKLMTFGKRDYDPTIGRWTTKDPIGFDGGDTNLYSYVGQDPMSNIDPSGLCPACFLASALFLSATPTETINAAKDEIINGAITVASFVFFEALPFLTNNRYLRIGEGKFPEPYSKRISIGNTPGSKIELGISPRGKIDFKFGEKRYTIKSGTQNSCPKNE